MANDIINNTVRGLIPYRNITNICHKLIICRH